MNQVRVMLGVAMAVLCLLLAMLPGFLFGSGWSWPFFSLVAIGALAASFARCTYLVPPGQLVALSLFGERYNDPLTPGYQIVPLAFLWRFHWINAKPDPIEVQRVGLAVRCAAAITDIWAYVDAEQSERATPELTAAIEEAVAGHEEREAIRAAVQDAAKRYGLEATVTVQGEGRELDPDRKRAKLLKGLETFAKEMREQGLSEAEVKTLVERQRLRIMDDET